jgi:hypothetical protein
VTTPADRNRLVVIVDVDDPQGRKCLVDDVPAIPFSPDIRGFLMATDADE